tara:strand:- start:513 stop:902 length:390 start_codon:yes stop_codon:yes gene_type:complete
LDTYGIAMENEYPEIFEALARIGAAFYQHQKQLRSDEITDLYLFNWRQRLIEFSTNIIDGPKILISKPIRRKYSDPEWESVFSYTVPGYDHFNDSQIIEWVSSIPHGEAYIPFLAENIIKLDRAVDRPD